ncbi:MAG: topoisomerase IV, partial [Ruminococcaceae bacterium]|nr:topoisomerase IV [Oscillospiraceae bacterium]
EWLNWRRICIRREIAYELEKKRERLHLLHGLEKILLDIDKAIQIIRGTEKESDVIPNLMQGFAIDQPQAEFVAEIRLRQLNRQYILQRTGDIQALAAEIADLQDVLENKERIDERICQTLEQIAAKYGKPRQSRLVQIEKVNTLDEDQLIEDFNLRLFLTEHGYLKKLALTSLRSAGELKTKEEDRIIQEIEGKNKADVLLFSDRGNVYKMKCFDIKDHKPSDLGEYTPNLLGLEDGERILFIHMTDDYAGRVLIGFASGKFTKLPLNVYETKTNRKKLVNAFSTASPVVGLFYLDDEAEDDFVAVSNIRKVLVFDSGQVPQKTTRTNQGVNVLLSKKGSYMTSCHRLSESNIKDDQYYRKKQIPGVGTYLKEETLDNRQLGLDGV